MEKEIKEQKKICKQGGIHRGAKEAGDCSRAFSKTNKCSARRNINEPIKEEEILATTEKVETEKENEIERSNFEIAKNHEAIIIEEEKLKDIEEEKSIVDVDSIRMWIKSSNINLLSRRWRLNKTIRGLWDNIEEKLTSIVDAPFTILSSISREKLIKALQIENIHFIDSNIKSTLCTNEIWINSSVLIKILEQFEVKFVRVLGADLKEQDYEYLHEIIETELPYSFDLASTINCEKNTIELVDHIFLRRLEKGGSLYHLCGKEGYGTLQAKKIKIYNTIAHHLKKKTKMEWKFDKQLSKRSISSKIDAIDRMINYLQEKAIQTFLRIEITVSYQNHLFENAIKSTVQRLEKITSFLKLNRRNHVLIPLEIYYKEIKEQIILIKREIIDKNNIKIEKEFKKRELLRLFNYCGWANSWTNQIFNKRPIEDIISEEELEDYSIVVEPKAHDLSHRIINQNHETELFEEKSQLLITEFIEIKDIEIKNEKDDNITAQFSQYENFPLSSFIKYDRIIPTKTKELLDHLLTKYEEEEEEYEETPRWIKTTISSLSLPLNEFDLLMTSNIDRGFIKVFNFEKALQESAILRYTVYNSSDINYKKSLFLLKKQNLSIQTVCEEKSKRLWIFEVDISSEDFYLESFEFAKKSNLTLFPKRSISQKYYKSKLINVSEWLRILQIKYYIDKEINKSHNRGLLTRCRAEIMIFANRKTKKDVRIVKKKEVKEHIKNIALLAYNSSEISRQQIQKTIKRAQQILSDRENQNSILSVLEQKRLEEEKEKEINFSPPHIRSKILYKGLQNRGYECYSNAVLQIMFNLKIIFSYLLAMKNDIANQIVLMNQQRILGKHRAVSIQKDILNTLLEFNEEKSFANQEDAHEYMVRLLEKIEIFKKEDSIFELTWNENVECNYCYCESINFFKATSLSLVCNDFEEVEITSLLKQHFNQNIVERHCDMCNKNEATISSTIRKIPTILILQLKIFEHQQSKGSKKLLTTNLKNMEEIYLRHEEYKLKGFITHLGKSLGSGHYKAYVFEDLKWVEYNDLEVHELTQISLEHLEIPYILFYERS